jgi:hypothetical protein
MQVTTGGCNTGVGGGVLYNNTSGTNNTAVGYFALVANTTGSSENTAVGQKCSLSVLTPQVVITQQLVRSSLTANTTGSS